MQRDQNAIMMAFLSKSRTGSPRDVCVVCMDSDKSVCICFLDCGHVTYCESCYAHVKSRAVNEPLKCPKYRRVATRDPVKVFL